MPSTIAQLDFDHHSPEFAQDPRKDLATLRANGITYSPHHGGFYVLARYEDVRKAALDPRTLTQGRAHGADEDDPLLLGEGIPSIPLAMSVIPSESDPPDHTLYRKALAPYFTAKAVEHARERLLHWTTVCLDERIESGRIDFLADLTAPVMFVFFYEMLGLPVDEWRRWQEPVHVLMTRSPDDPEVAEAVAKYTQNRHELEALADERRRDPREDMISKLATSEVRGRPLTDNEVARLALNVMLGAVDSVASLASQALHHLSREPQDRERLANDPELYARAVEEFLRVVTPNHGIGRTVGRETEILGQRLKPGDRVLLSWMAANTDPDVFEEPERVILDRSPNPHLAFGAGIHKCVGLQYARAATAIFLQQVIERMPDYEVIEDEVVPLRSIAMLNGYASIPARFTPGERRQDQRLPG